MSETTSAPDVDAVLEQARQTLYPSSLSLPDADGTFTALLLLQSALIQVRSSPRLCVRLQHAITRLDRPLERELFGSNAVQIPETEQGVLSMLRSIATDLHTAGQALDVAAEHLKNAGKGFQAGQTKQAAQNAHRAAEGLVNG